MFRLPAPHSAENRQDTAVKPLESVDSAESQTTPNPATRLDYLDNLRILLTCMVIWHHLAVALGGAGGWYYRLPWEQNTITPILLTVFTAINQCWFMSMFFAISAWVTPAAVDRKGVPSFVRSRLLRLGIPLIVYYFLLNPSVRYLVVCIESGERQGYFKFMSEQAAQEFGLGPLWFVLALLLFSGAYLFFRRRLGTVSSASLPFPSNKMIALFVLANAIAAYLVRIRVPAGDMIMGLMLGYFPLYISMYTVGVLAYRHNWLPQLTLKQSRLWVLLAIGVTMLLPVLLTVVAGNIGDVSRFMGGGGWRSFVYAVWEPVLCVGISMRMLVLFRDQLNRSNALTRTMARSTYTVYIIHPFVVVAGTYLSTRLPVGPMAQFLVLCVTSVIVCFAISEVIRRLPLASRVL